MDGDAEVDLTHVWSCAEPSLAGWEGGVGPGVGAELVSHVVGGSKQSSLARDSRQQTG